MRNIKQLENQEHLIKTLKEIAEQQHNEGFFLYLIMHSVSKEEHNVLAGFYNPTKNIVKTAKFIEDSWLFDSSEDQIVSQEIPKEIDLDDFIPLDKIIKNLSQSEPDFNKYLKIIASLSFNNENETPVWNLLVILDTHKVKNLKINAKSQEIISNEEVNLIKRA
ncbi:MAG: hypothetical protein PWP03_352 [Candidatus Woesearchaeota archaeon]|nr:hypothetical protein [Candidatus Woesearchaeota archaeon]MDN5327714.1 hypothetical protein [Candidatus Woesearchaeota archaeon]